MQGISSKAVVNDGFGEELFGDYQLLATKLRSDYAELDGKTYLIVLDRLLHRSSKPPMKESRP